MRSTYVEVTKNITGISLSVESGRIKRTEHPVSVIVLSKGVFKSRVIFVFPAQFLHDVVDRMSRGEKLSDEDRKSYAKEYLNICFGRFVSTINNFIGKASRFVVPVIINGAYSEGGYAGSKDDIVQTVFATDYGTIKISIEYDLLPEHSSN